MNSFTYIEPQTVSEAASTLSQYGTKAWLIGGGTDVIGTMKDYVFPSSPEVIVNLQSIPDLAYIKEEGGMLKIGATTVLEDIATSSIVQSKYPALAQAASRTASPHLREMGTIAGNICQMNRCWFFRSAYNRFNCIRKGGGMCYATAGENRYHSIFGGIAGCVAVNPSDTAPALVAMDAKIVTSKRTINAEEFWDMKIPGSTVLDEDEIVTEVQVPAPPAGAKSAFIKLAIRKSIDFPIVNCAAMISDSDARICLNAVFNKPYRATKAEDAIKGKVIDAANAEAAGAAAVQGAMALTHNKWKIQAAKGVVKQTILACQ